MRRRTFDLPRWLILALTLIRNLAQQAVFRPSEIRHLDHDLGFDPVYARQLERRTEPALAGRRDIERHACSFQRREPPSQSRELGDRDPRAHPASISQASILGVVAEEKRADVRTASRRIGPSDDDKLLAIETFRLNPETTIAGRISSPSSLAMRRVSFGR